MKIIVIGGDGFCGWPTSLHLAKHGHEVLIVDNLSRRKIDKEIDSNSLTDIASIEERIKTANELIGTITYENLNVAEDYASLLTLINNFNPTTIIHFGEQRAAPYSMIGSSERRYTVDNNINGTHNVCSAIIESKKDIHLVHLGTMGVYGYSKDFGSIPEGYLNIKINQTNKDVDILYPANPGSIYHMTKCLDQLIFQYYNKNWGLAVTDLHQGIVWGIETEETRQNKILVNRFDYDGIYGTVLNRFITQAVNNFPLTVYGTGGQSRAFIHISDTAKCIRLASESRPAQGSKVRIFNQISEVQSVLSLAKLISSKTGIDINYLENPRNELAENDLEVANDGLMSLGFKPILLDESLIDDVVFLSEGLKEKFDKNNVTSSPKWN